VLEGHDWTLKSIQYDWQEAQGIFIFETAGEVSRILVASGVVELNVPQKREWGASVSVNKIGRPLNVGELKKLTIEMQSGDVITVIASDFSLEMA